MSGAEGAVAADVGAEVSEHRAAVLELLRGRAERLAGAAEAIVGRVRAAGEGAPDERTAKIRRQARASETDVHADLRRLEPPARSLAITQLRELGCTARSLEAFAPALPPPSPRARPAPAPSQPYPGFALNDDGNAERFLDLHVDDVRHVSRVGWHVWRGGRWEEDVEEHVFGLATATARGIEIEADQVLHSTGDPRLVKAVMAHSVKSGSVKAREAMLVGASRDPRVRISIAALDADPWLFGVANGTIDMRTGVRLPPIREHLITQRAPVAHDPRATCPIWDAFLATSQPDPDVRGFLARLCGYTATGVVRQHIFPMLIGGGANGKGTFIRALLALLGTYGCSVPSDLFISEKGQHPTIKMTVRGKRLAIGQETEHGAHLDAATIKNLSGGDEITARLMGQNFVKFLPTHKLMLATNARPIITDTSAGTWRRLLPVDWPVSFEGREDLDLDGKLLVELPGILNWVIAGCAEWQRIGLAPPASVIAERERYRSHSDPFAAFLADSCRCDVGARVAKSELYDAYARWCEGDKDRRTGDRGQGLIPLGARHFGERMRQIGFGEIDSASVTFSAEYLMARSGKVGKRDRGWVGLRVKTDHDLQQDGQAHDLEAAARQAIELQQAADMGPP